MGVFCLLYVKEAEMVILLHLQSEVMIQADKIMREGNRKEGEGEGIGKGKKGEGEARRGRRGRGSLCLYRGEWERHKERERYTATSEGGYSIKSQAVQLLRAVQQHYNKEMRHTEEMP